MQKDLKTEAAANVALASSVRAPVVGKNFFKPVPLRKPQKRSIIKTFADFLKG